MPAPTHAARRRRPQQQWQHQAQAQAQCKRAGAAGRSAAQVKLRAAGSSWRPREANRSAQQTQADGVGSGQVLTAGSCSDEGSIFVGRASLHNIRAVTWACAASASASVKLPPQLLSAPPRSAAPQSLLPPARHIALDSACSLWSSANHAQDPPSQRSPQSSPIQRLPSPAHRSLPADCQPTRPRLCFRHAGPGRGRWARLVPNAARCVAIHSSGSVAARAALFGCHFTPNLPGSQQCPRGLQTVASRADYEQSRLSDKLMRVLQAR